MVLAHSEERDRHTAVIVKVPPTGSQIRVIKDYAADAADDDQVFVSKNRGTDKKH